jgi:hypothetical protein
MRGEVLKIKFRDDMAFLTDEVALNFNQVEISINPVKFKAPAFWTVRVINHIPQENKLFVEVSQYQVGETDFPPNQIALADKLLEIEKVTFRSIDTGGLLGTLNGNTGRTYFPPKQETVYRPEYTLHPDPKVEKVPSKQNYTEPFSVPIKDVTFLDGKVSFDKKIQLFKKQISFEIQNAHIIKAYDSIKNYFASVLKTKNIQVVPTIHALDGEIVSVAACSAEIDRIDQTLIEKVKYAVVNMVRKKDADDEPQVLTIPEFLDTLNDEGVKGQELFKDEEDFINNLLERSGTKHHSHLLFLSSKHAHNLTKLRLVTKPLSFIFLLAGSEQNHVIWETLDTTEATYIWSFPNKMDVKAIMKQVVDQKIKQIFKDGKSAYLQQKEENFTKIVHDYTDQYGFRKWKGEIEKVLKE